MVFQEIANNVDERFLTTRLSSGLTLIVNPKKGFSKTMGIMGVRFGSADNRLFAGNGADEERVPDGTAHFLEHKLFEDADGDVSDRFAANGAHCNASTGFTTTSYMFACTDKVLENLSLLLSFVQNPFFTEELVKKEQGIIGQEIKMYEDDPGWIVFFNLMESLYREHPVRNNIAGTVESIAGITPASLERCYRAFYRPGNMVLVVVGNIDPDEVYEVAQKDAARRQPDEASICTRTVVESDPSPKEQRVEAEMVVYRPKLLIGFKESEISNDGHQIELLELRTQIILDVLLSKSSAQHAALYQEELIDDTFSASYSSYGDFGFTLIGGDTNEPQRLKDRLLEVFAKARTQGLEKALFERVKNKYMGQYIRMFNSIESTAYSFLGCHFRGIVPSELVEMIAQVTLDEVEERLRCHFDCERMAASVVLPKAPRG